MSEEELIKRLKELKEEGAILGEDEVKTFLNLIEKQDKMIDLMTEQLSGLTIFDTDKDEPLILGDKEEVKEYFRKKIENGR